jgi:hypothetical protein
MITVIHTVMMTVTAIIIQHDSDEALLLQLLL